MLDRIMDYLRHTVFFPPDKRSAFAAQVAKQDLREQLLLSAVKTLPSLQGLLHMHIIPCAFILANPVNLQYKGCKLIDSAENKHM